MLNWKAVAMSAALCAVSATSAFAQADRDPVTRLNQLGGYAGQIAPCKFMGFEIHEDDTDRFANAAVAEASRFGVSESMAMIYLNDAVEKSAAAAKAATHGDQTNGPKFAALILGRVQGWVATCHQIAQDPIGRILVTDTATPDDVLTRKGADELLWTTGYASWQNDYIRAAGDMAYGVAVCGNHLTRAQYEAYLTPLQAPSAFPGAVRDRAERYMRFWTSQGEHDAEELKFDATQCKRILGPRAAKLKAAPR